MINTAMEAFLSKTEVKGTCLPKDELKKLNERLEGVIPEWFIELASTQPFTGVELGWLAYPTEEGEDSIECIQFLDVPLLEEINLDSYPGCFLLQLGYFVFGYGSSWAGNCFAFNPTEGIDPPVYEVWHDAAQDKDGMIEAIKNLKGVALVNDSFSGFIKNAVL